MFQTDQLWPGVTDDGQNLPAVLTDILTGAASPWDLLERLDAALAELRDQRAGFIHPSAVVEGPVVLAEGATVGPAAYIKGPAWIGPGASIGHGAYLRGGVYVGSGA